MPAIEDTHPHAIKDVASMLGVTHRTLRFYEELHFISPMRKSGTRRSYSDADVAHLRKITHLASLGFSLIEVKQLLNFKSENQLIEALHRRRAEVAAEIEHLQKVLCDISVAIAGHASKSKNEAA